MSVASFKRVCTGFSGVIFTPTTRFESHSVFEEMMTVTHNGHMFKRHVSLLFPMLGVRDVTQGSPSNISVETVCDSSEAIQLRWMEVANENGLRSTSRYDHQFEVKFLTAPRLADLIWGKNAGEFLGSMADREYNDIIFLHPHPELLGVRTHMVMEMIRLFSGIHIDHKVMQTWWDNGPRELGGLRLNISEGTFLDWDGYTTVKDTPVNGGKFLCQMVRGDTSHGNPLMLAPPAGLILDEKDMKWRLHVSTITNFIIDSLRKFRINIPSFLSNHPFNNYKMIPTCRKCGGTLTADNMMAGVHHTCKDANYNVIS